MEAVLANAKFEAGCGCGTFWGRVILTRRFWRNDLCGFNDGKVSVVWRGEESGSFLRKI
jgi:hypothetical protein